MKAKRVRDKARIAGLVATNGIDLFTTHLAIQSGASEGNGIMLACSVDTVPEIAMWKAIGIVVIILFILATDHFWLLDIINSMLAIVCAWNIFIVLKGVGL